MGDRETCPECWLELPRSGVCGDPSCEYVDA